MRATPSLTFPAPTGFTLLDESASGAINNLVNYGTGAIAFALRSQLASASSYTRKVSYQRAAASHARRVALAYEGIVWAGRSSKVVTGDMLYNNGTPLGGIVKMERLSPTGAPVSPWGDNAVLVLNAAALSKNQQISSWYIEARNLSSESTRTTPELTLSALDQKATLRASLNRDAAGIPVSGTAQIYAGYRALRLDVSQNSANPTLLTVTSAEDIANQIGPIDPSNPLAFGLYMAAINAPGVTIYGLGVDETSANSPDGTSDAYLRALEYLRRRSEPYALVPLSQDLSVMQLFVAHVTSESLPENKHERVVYSCPKLPTEKSPVLLISGSGVTAEQTTETKWEFTFGETVNIISAFSSAKDANGFAISASIGSTFTPAQGVFLTRSGDPYRYLVTKLVSATTVEVDLGTVYDEDQGPGTYGNGDGYYRVLNTSLLLFDAAGESVSLSVRQAAITTDTPAGKKLIVGVLRSMGEAYANRRLNIVQPEQVVYEIDGLEVVVPGYYLCANIAGMVSGYSVSQGFTNLPIVGPISPVGSSDLFEEADMAIAAAGGINWIIQDKQGEPLVSRHQLTTDMSSLTRREASTVRSIDYCAKLLRAACRRFIGTTNVTKKLVRTLHLSLESACKAASGSAVQRLVIDGITLPPAELDTAEVEASVLPYYATNAIKIRLFA
jgi:hypothetical protein